MVIDFHTHTYPDKMAAATLAKLSGVSHLRPFTHGTAGRARPPPRDRREGWRFLVVPARQSEHI